MAQKTFMSSLLASVGDLFFKGKDKEAHKLASVFKKSRNKSPEQLIPIKNKRDLEKARDTWDKAELRKLPKRQRKEFAEYMVQKSNVMRMKPLSYWRKLSDGR